MTAEAIIRGGPRERLVDGAIAMFHEQGYRGVGVQALCEVAGVRKGSFYHFFASKEDLALEALNTAWDVFRSVVILPILERGLDPADRDEAIRRACLDADGHTSIDHGPHGCMFVRLAASITDAEPMLAARLAEIFTEWASLLGGGTEGWSALADIQGRLLMGFLVQVPEPMRI